MPYLSTLIQDRIDQKLHKLESLRPLPSSAVRKLKEQFEIEMTYNSNAIEGNSLTLKETYLVIHEGLTVKGKPLKDHLEAKDHHEALEFLYDLVGTKSKPTISEHLIREFHSLVVKKTEEEFAGKYRTSNVFIGGADHTPPDALQVAVHMKNLMPWFVKARKKIHPIELSTLLHHKLVYIHPFFDGNGRTARLMMNIILMKVGYPLVVILKNDRKKYYRVLAQADKGDYSLLVRFVAQAVERSLDIYLKVLTPMTMDREEFQLLSEISPKTPYSTKYLNLLARQGKLEAHKQGRNWLTSIESVRRYVGKKERERDLDNNI
ncbi:MAG: Fic family protein [Candidatus Pacebacteria bacterium]|jgi:Fic family protein|nr:Fic family protein [Candidatus Paceibacterota bacterium]MBT3511742.1 Fic family protein [Candidatus Paceibacterota bacterium]MBT4004807.1 Fic family protein [Candidatus Paceibacterota bacterium]MBT4358486.1 Fic family protein [Candidatus Paceibacterota bacterium]MBT4680618.1 Fic family protein [Candidatus Paceibacterota bacterium]